MSRHMQAIPLLALALVAAACDSPLGRDLPVCDEVANSIVIQVQSVRGTEYVPCVHGLKTGWDYEHVRADSSASAFWLDSDRMGSHFLEVRLESSCDTTGATEVPSDEEAVPLFADVEASFELAITVVPEGSALQTFIYAQELEAELRDEIIGGRRLAVEIDRQELPTATRISHAQAAGSVVLSVSVRDAEEATLTVFHPVGGEHQGLSLGETRDLLEDSIEPPSYRGFWYYPYANGCTTYVFNAEGPGVETIEQDVQAALGFWSGDVLRQIARDLGYDVY